MVHCLLLSQPVTISNLRTAPTGLRFLAGLKDFPPIQNFQRVSGVQPEHSVNSGGRTVTEDRNSRPISSQSRGCPLDMCVYVYTNVCLCLHKCVFMSTQMCVCLHKCVFMYTQMCVHVYTN